MGDMGDMWREVKDASKVKRANNRAGSADRLNSAGIAYTSKNGGAHLIVQGNSEVIDFWPGTGLWVARPGNMRQYGVAKLIKYAQNCEP